MKKSRILVVDQDKNFVNRVRNWLLREGYIVFKAADQAEALQKCGDHSMDLVLIDEQLVNMEGENLFHEIRKLFPEVFIPMIALLGIKKVHPEYQYFKWGADGCFHKWTALDKLVFHIYSLLRIREQYSHLEGIKAYNEEIISNIPVSILILTPRQKVKFANQHFCHKMRLTASEIIGNRLDKVLTLPLYEDLRLSQSIREVRSLGEPSRGYKISYGGSYYFYKLLPITVGASESLDLMLMMQDITEVEELSRELSKSEERYRNLFRNSVEPISMVDLNGRFIMVNERMCTLFKYPRQTFMKKDIYTLVYHEDFALFEDVFGKAAEGKRGAATVRMTTKKKELLHVEMSMKKIVGREENLVQIIMRDVTQRLELEEQLRQSEKMSALGQFTAGATHEINNPLSIVSSYVQYLLSQYGDGRSHSLKPREVKELIKTLKIVNKETQRCGKIVNSLLQFSRKARIEKENLDVGEIVEKTLSILGRQLKFSGISINRRLAKKLPRVRGNYNLLHQVFMNLILNAREAMPEGGRLLVRTAGKKKRVEVEIQDGGKGIPRDMVSRIFDPFYTTGRGTGLGLSVVHSIVKDHGGSIVVRSKPEKGTSFLIRLPARGGRAGG